MAAVAHVHSNVSPLCGCCHPRTQPQAWLAEWMWTTLLVMVVLSTASSKRASNNYFGLSIGAIVLTGDAFFGEWSNGMFNPAVGLGTCAYSVVQKVASNGLIVYLVRAACSQRCHYYASLVSRVGVCARGHLHARVVVPLSLCPRSHCFLPCPVHRPHVRWAACVAHCWRSSCSPTPPRTRSTRTRWTRLRSRHPRVALLI